MADILTYFGMAFKVINAVYNTAAALFQSFSPSYVVGLVKTSPKLYKNGYIFAVFCGSAQLMSYF